MLFWYTLRALAVIALVGFLTVGLAFAFKPQWFTGADVTRESALWHSLSLAFMATVSIIALMIALKPEKYWEMLLPLAIGKAVSSISSLSWARVHTGSSWLELNTVVDGTIALIAISLYTWAKIHRPTRHVY